MSRDSGGEEIYKRGLNVRDLVSGRRVDETFLIAETPSLRETKRGWMVRAVLADRTGQVNAVYFTEDEGDAERVRAAFCSAFDERKPARVEGEVGEYQNVRQVRVRGVFPAPEPHEPLTRFAAVPDERARASVRELLSRVKGAVGSSPGERRGDGVRREHGAALFGDADGEVSLALSLLAAFERDGEFLGAFAQAPAAKTYHHAWPGGLVAHTLSVVSVVDVASRGLEEGFSRPVALLGALFHDVGKVRAYEVGSTSIEDTGEGRLLGHVVLGVEHVRRLIEGAAVRDELFSLRLLHIVASHHGEAAWGAIVQPASAEALMVHNADKLDADVAHAIDLRASGETYSRRLSRRLL